MKNSKTKTLVECSIMIALATVLSLIKLYTLPLGGAVTLLSMLPICMISFRHGLKTGLFSSFAYSVLQLCLDIPSLMSWGLTVRIWIGAIIFDYLIAFTVLGIAGIFRKKGTAGIIAGTTLALFLRFVSHVISGTIFFDIWCPEGWQSPFIYSICYNGSFILPELILTLLALSILLKLPQTHSFVYADNNK